MTIIREPAGPAARIESGEHERRLATGALAQQVSQVSGTLIMLAVVTVLGRSLSLAEFGTYGLLVSSATYLLLVQTSVEGAAVRAIAVAQDQPARDRAFSTALVLYLAAGLLASVVVAGGGYLMVGLLGIPHQLRHEDREAVVLLGAVILIGWPLRVSQDILRGSHRFVEAAVAEVAGYLVFGVVTIAIVALDLPLWLLIGFGGTIPALTGLCGTALVVFRRLPYRWRRGAVDNRSIREFASLSGYLLIGGASDLVIYALDRVLLAAFRGIASVGFYEGPVRVHNLLRMIQGTLVGTVLPAAARFVEQGDDVRLGDLILRGTRYVLVATLPITITLMVLAKPLLEAWLGAKFGVASVALTILIAYWLINVNMSVAAGMLVASGHARWLAGFAWQLGALNLAFSIVLTWQFGLNGVVLGTTIPNVLLFPVYMSKILSTLPLTLKALVRHAWIPAYGIGVVLAGALVAARLLLPVHTLAEVVAAGAAGPLIYWAVFYAVWTTPGERELVRTMVHGTVARVKSLGPRPS
jgi:O-antigen/teichoic acid export membrane protein